MAPVSPQLTDAATTRLGSAENRASRCVPISAPILFRTIRTIRATTILEGISPYWQAVGIAG
jgi:hypothetical protein